MKAIKCNITFAKRAMEDLIWLREELHARTIADAIRSCISLFLYLYKEKKDGAEIIIKKNGREKMIIDFSQ